MNEPNMTTIDQIKQELRDIIELSDKATPAPWKSYGGDPWEPIVWEQIEGKLGQFTGLEINKNCRTKASERNAALTAASRNLTPKMARALLGTLEILEHMTTYTTKAGTVASTALETICREWEVKA